MMIQCDFIDASRHKWMRERGGEWEEGIMAFGNGGDRVAVKYHQQKKMYVKDGV